MNNLRRIVISPEFKVLLGALIVLAAMISTALMNETYPVVGIVFGMFLIGFGGGQLHERSK